MAYRDEAKGMGTGPSYNLLLLIIVSYFLMNVFPFSLKTLS